MNGLWFTREVNEVSIPTPMFHSSCGLPHLNGMSKKDKVECK